MQEEGVLRMDDPDALSREERRLRDDTLRAEAIYRRQWAVERVLGGGRVPPDPVEVHRVIRAASLLEAYVEDGVTKTPWAARPESSGISDTGTAPPSAATGTDRPAEC